MALSEVEGLRCLRSLLSFDRLTILSEVEGLAAYYLYVSVGAPPGHSSGIYDAAPCI